MGMLLTRHYADRNNTENKGVAKAVAPEVPEQKQKAEKKPTVSADEIKAMNGNKLRKFATENGIENQEELTVGELKAILVEKFS